MRTNKNQKSLNKNQIIHVNTAEKSDNWDDYCYDFGGEAIGEVQYTADDFCSNPFLFSFLNKEDRDLFLLQYICKKTQHELAVVLQRSQAGICQHEKKLKQRLEHILFLESQFDLYMSWLQNESQKYKDRHVYILTYMYYCGNLEQVSRIIGSPRNSLQFTFRAILKKLKQNRETIYPLFLKISENTNLIKRKSYIEMFDHYKRRNKNAATKKNSTD